MGSRQRTFFLHLHPPSVPAETLRFSLSLGLGGICTVLLILLAGSGILLLPAYRPEVGSAHAVVAAFSGPGRLAGWVRNIHFLAANLLVAAAVFHLLRVFLTGALNHFCRRLNWITGIALLLFCLAANFSGYLLVWDQKSYWAVTVFTGMIACLPVAGPGLAEIIRGGSSVGPATLSGFFAFHVVIIPALMLLLSAWHFWLVRRAGGLVRRPLAGPGAGSRPTVPDLVVREAAISLGVVALVMYAAILFSAPLQPPANPGLSPNPARAPWYFIALQEMMLHFHPAFAIAVFPLLGILFLAGWPLGKKHRLPPGTWFGGRPPGPAAAALAAGLTATFILVVFDERWLKTMFCGPANIFTRGLLPFAALASGAVLSGYILRRKLEFSPAEAGALLLLSGLGGVAALTLAGWLRGPGMKLILPF